MLWTWPATGFVPHCAAHAPLARETPVLIASGDERPKVASCCSTSAPTARRTSSALRACSRSSTPRDREAGRSRYRFYQERGYKITNHDLAQEGQ